MSTVVSQRSTRSAGSGGCARRSLSGLTGLLVALWSAALMAGCAPQQPPLATEPVPTLAKAAPAQTPTPPGETTAMPSPAATPATPAPAQTATPPAAAAPAFRDLADFRQHLAAAVVGGAVEPFWQAVVDLGHMPLIFGDTAVFLYRGPGQSVVWRGDFTLWDRAPAAAGARQGQTDIWLMTRQFPLDARLDYKIIVDGTYLLDPLNPRTQLGGYGPNSVLYMPDYRYPEETLPRPGVAQGQLSEPLTIRSRALGYDVQYQVYTPTGYETLQDLPVIYATDGQEYAHPDMGALPIVLDNLIAAGAIRPVMAVSIDMRDPATGYNRRDSLLVADDRFQQFLVAELVPAIDQTYRTRGVADGRAILGTSLGGLHAAYTGLHHPDVFGMAAIYSPYFRAWPAVLTGYSRAGRLPLKVFMMQGIYDFDVENTRQLRVLLDEKGYALQYLETADGHSWGNWRGVMGDVLRFFWATK